ncbi:MAG: TetM/TetW/TetO/TetS family tetracycline resistance ribosomal protection protein [Defluviitaleaceae bacterium]|nr:TetM/TetW/TetO/TetS family tetracycline resistance ribosomal protection protein [Defluviitaleaceae bacterium]
MQIINLGLLAHVDAGKTTTVEQMLFHSGNLRTLGSVDKGDTQTDFLAIERERGISVTSASVEIDAGDVQIRMIDTPGHMDFSGEVERTLAVLDGAVLIVSAAEGIQSQTERLWRALREINLPTIIFLNKVDRMGCEPEAVLAALQKEFSPVIIPVNRCVNAGSAEVSVENCDISEDGILELCENDSALAEKYLQNEKLSPQEIKTALVRQTRECLAFPLVYGAAAMSVGIDAFTLAIKAFLPSKPLLPEGAPVGTIYKIEHDKALGKIAHIRLFEGTLKNRDAVNIFRPSHGEAEQFAEKITQIHKVSGAKREDTGVIRGNEIAAVCGLARAKVGDMVGQAFEQKNIRISEPLFMVKIFGADGKERELLQAVSELSDEDPLMDYTWNADLRELVIRVMGKIQIEILQYLFLERYGLAVTFSPPSVIYKETITRRGIGLERYTMPKPCWAVVKLQADPLPRGSGYMYECSIGESVLRRQYRNHVETAVAEALKQGRLGWEATDLKITLIDGQDHKFHTHPLDFFLATPIAVMRALEDAEPILLEPLVKLKLVADETLSGRLIGDIIEMRGDFDNPVMSGGKVEMEAIVPVAASVDYFVRFASLTSGRGTLNSDFYGYKECPLELGTTAARRDIDPLDRDKWILHKRGAL